MDVLDREAFGVVNARLDELTLHLRRTHTLGFVPATVAVDEQPVRSDLVMTQEEVVLVELGRVDGQMRVIGR